MGIMKVAKYRERAAGHASQCADLAAKAIERI